MAGLLDASNTQGGWGLLSKALQYHPTLLLFDVIRRAMNEPGYSAKAENYMMNESWPAVAGQAALRAAQTPGDVAQGLLDPMSDEGIGRSMDMAGLTNLGGLSRGLLAAGGNKAAGGAYATAKGTAPEGIRAYHGSPHEFDRFSMEKIGTGEGAQAYGHGLYFAENEGVARAYRDALSRTVTGDDAYDLATHSLLRTQFKNNTRVPANYDEAMGIIKKEIEYYDAAGWPSSEYKKQYTDAMNYLRDWESAGGPGEHMLRGTPGRMYEVTIKANPDEFLDWDKPLYQQSEKVRDALATKPPLTTAPGLRDPQKGHGLIEMLSGSARDKRAATEELKRRGIKGIRYLDQGSRGEGAGTYNYVIFDDNLVDINRKYAQGNPLVGGAYATARGSQGTN